MEKRIMNDERSQLEAWGKLERTDLGQQQFDQARICPDVAGLDPYSPVPQTTEQTTEEFLRDRRLRFFTTIQQQIEAEEYYPREPIAQEDYMQDSIDDLFTRGVITDEEAVSIFGNWITNRRPNTRVVKVTPQPRGYGRGYMNE
jgi:hypothetical protein